MTAPNDMTFQVPPSDEMPEGSALWTTIDFGLLYLVIIVSSDSLVRLGFGQSVVWLLCYGLTLLRLTMVWPQFFEVAMRNKVVFLYPMACLASVVWSVDKGTSLMASIQLSMTIVIATYLGWRYSLRAIIKATMIVMSVAVLLSLLHWATGVFPWRVFSPAGGLVGVFSQKNMLGQRALFCIVITLTVLLMLPFEARARLKVWAIFTLFTTLVALWLSKSMTSVLLVPVMVGLLATICFRRIPPLVALVSICVTLSVIAIGPVALSIAGIDPVATVLDAVGKDASLTGRTELWEVARHVSAQHPVFGVGYGAFWTSSEFAYERLLTQHAGATTSTSFHNFSLEILVGAGWPALLAMFALLVTNVRRLAMVFSQTYSVAAACALVLFVTIIVTSLLGPSLYRGHEFMITLMVMFTVSAQEDWLQIIRQQLDANKPATFISRRTQPSDQPSLTSFRARHNTPVDTSRS